MKRTTLALVAMVLSLAACGNTAAVSYTLTFTTEDAVRKSALTLASLHVVERRLASLGEEDATADVSTSGTPTISVFASNKVIGEVLTNELTQPFDLQVMREAGTDAPDISVENHGGFKATGITQEHIEWMEAGDEGAGKGHVLITFTEEGRTKMAEVFKQNNGKFIGLFVRGKLVSKLLVDTDTLLDEVVISGIPSVDLARVFADDVNVGLHVTFTPVL